jgi:hypothetical protein
MTFISEEPPGAGSRWIHRSRKNGMSIEEDSGIEFEIGKLDEELADVLRDSYRLPFRDIEKARATIAGQSYTIVNISAHGIAIRLDTPHTFAVDQMIHGVCIVLGEYSHMVSGSVVHISPVDPEAYICGIRFVYQDGAVRDNLSKSIRLFRSVFFGDRTDHK